jgi:disulfide bond formation protein DsbB
LGIINALAVIIPGLFLLALIRGVKLPPLRILTVLLASFGILHGIYHVLLIFGASTIANPVDLGTVLLLVAFGVYYRFKVG